MAGRSTAPYWRIAGELRTEIEEGTFPPGTGLPSILDLARRFGVSKATISNALRALSEEGLVRTEAGRGVLVLDPQATRIQLRHHAGAAEQQTGSWDWEAACERQGLHGQVVPVAVGETRPNAHIAQRLGLAPEAAALRRYQHALLNGRPAQLQTAWYPAELVAGSAFADAYRLSTDAHTALRELGLTPATTDDTVTARGATPPEAKELRINAGSPVLVVESLTRDASGVPLELLQITADPLRTQMSYDALPLPPR